MSESFTTKEQVNVFSSVVIREGRARDYRELINIASSCAKQKERTNNDISIKEIVFCPKTHLYVAIYEVPASSNRRRMKSRVVRRRSVSM